MLEEISKPAENQDTNEEDLVETSGKDFEADGKKTEKEGHQNNGEWEIIDGTKKFDSNGDTNGNTKYV